MWQVFEQSLNRYRELEQQLSNPSLVADRAHYTRVAKEHGSLARQVKPYLEYKKLAEDLAQAKALAVAETDPEMKLYAEQELADLEGRRQALQSRLEDFLLIEGEAYDSVIVEIRAGTGGDEAALFAGDLYSMYTHYARDQGWKVEDISFSQGEQGGFKEVVFSITGDEAFR